MPIDPLTPQEISPSLGSNLIAGKRRPPTPRMRPDGRCEGPGCTRTVKGGLVHPRKVRYFCSKNCERRDAWSRRSAGDCEHCGGPIFGYRNGNRQPRFCSREHEHLFHEERLLKPAGPFRDVLSDYLEVATFYSPSTLRMVRLSLGHFLGYAVQEEKIESLDRIGPAVIGRYIACQSARGLTSRNYVSHIATFFRWLIAEERVNMVNPVIPRIHHQKSAPTAPRPYTDNEIAELRRILEKNGDPVLLLAFALGEECGLRVSEVCNLRIDDVKAEAQMVFVRLPTKNMRTRTVPYHGRVAQWLNRWVKLRNPECQHDHLLHGGRMGKYDGPSLDRRFHDLLSQHPSPARNFSFHRLRHTWATRLMNNGVELAVLKELGGWENWNSMQRYVKVLPETIRRQYTESCARIEREQESSSHEAISLIDFARSGASA